MSDTTYMYDGEQRTALPFDIDLVLNHPSMRRMAADLKKARTPKGVFRVIHGSVQLDGSGNGVAVGTEQPGGGRIWFLRAFAVFDAQNPTKTSTQTTTQAVTNVVLGATTVATANLNSFPVTVAVSGGTVTAISINGVTTNATSGSFVLQPGGLIAVTYSAPPTLTTTALGTSNQSTSTTGLISIYAEPTPPNLIAGSFSPNPPNPNGIIVPSVLGLPNSMTFTNWAYKIWNQENLFAVIQGALGTSGQIGFVARVSEYYIEDVELMHT